MLRILLFWVVSIIAHSSIASVFIEYPTSRFIEERHRGDLDGIDPIFRYYITPREIQVDANARKDDLPFFLRCKGSEASIQFTIPPSAAPYLSLETDQTTRTITARLLVGQLITSDLVGRYTCSEKVNNKDQETTVHVFIQNDRSLFTKQVYPKVFKDTGVHFFNIPCQTTHWYARMSCPISSNSEQCIPVYYTPTSVKAKKVFFDPQIGFALENPTISDRLDQFICISNSTSNQESRIPFDATAPEWIDLYPPNLTVLKDETVRLTCKIRYATDRNTPRVFWFEDIHHLQLISNKTQQPIYDPERSLYHQTSILILKGFQPGQVYRFDCVRDSNRGLYSRSVDITCVKTLPLDAVINFTRTAVDEELPYVSNKIIAKSSIVEQSDTIKPKVTDNPVGEFTFIPNQIPRTIPWRNDQLHVYSSGIQRGESYRILCNVRHRADQKQSLTVFIQYYQCSIENCLSDLIDKQCRSSDRNSISTTAHRVDKLQTQFVSDDSHRIEKPSIGHQYLCCYQHNGLINIAKAIVVISQNRNLFTITKPEPGLVTGDTLTYRCEAHQLLYDDLRMIYNDGSSTYVRSRLDRAWRLKGGGQVQKLDIDWKSPTKPSTDIQTIAIEVKTPLLTTNRNQGYFQCIARSKRLDFIPDGNDTYIIHVGELVPLSFKNYFQRVSRLDRKAGDYVKLDCAFHGRPKPKVSWMKGKSVFHSSESTLQLDDNNASLLANRAQASDTGYYTCILDNGHGGKLERSFDLRVKGNNPYSRFGRLTALIVLACVILFLLMLIVMCIFGIKYFQMTKHVREGIYHGKQAVGTEDTTQPALGQLAQIPLPDNFAARHQIDAFLNYVNGKTEPSDLEDFKELGRGQYGVVYQVRLPDVGLVAAKILPESIRRSKHQRDKRKKSDDVEENQEMISNQEYRKKKAVEMLIDEIKVMHKAGKHVNIVALKKVAYPEAKLKLLFTGGPLADEDSFYLMELCSNGSLESMLKRFLQPSSNQSDGKLSLYETLSNRPESTMTVAEAYNRCRLTDDDLKLIAYQVACGVDYLNRRQIAHCDIAARNVLVTTRFTMKICDFGLATWTTYKNYREQLAKNDSVQLDKKNDEIATHNLTPELARAFLRASSPDERSLLNRLSIKSDVWSFGIFLWTLFLKCRIRPFNKLLEEMQRRPDGESFFHRLARMISDGRVLRYIDYHPEIPRDIYGIIRDCLVEENRRPEMTRIRSYLCHSNTLSKRAFEYYRSEYNRYQEENAIDGNVELFPEDQGVSDLPLFEGDSSTYDSLPLQGTVTFRPTTTSELYYPAPSGETVPPTKPNYRNDSYV